MSGYSRFIMSALFCVVLLMTVFTDDAAACSCQYGGTPPCQEYWKTDVVFAGTVAGVAKITINEGSDSFEKRLVRFEVTETFRGEQAAKAEVVTGLGFGDCGYVFNVGETYLVYAERNKSDKRLYTSVCTRTRPISHAAEDLDYIRNSPYLAPGAAIFGKVNKPNYQAKSGESFSAPVSSANLIIEGASSRIETQTDAQGAYRITGLAPGAYKVELKVPKGLTSSGMSDDAMVEGKAEVVERGCQQVDFYLVPDTSLSGRVVDAFGKPVAGLRLDIRGAPSDPRNVNNFLDAKTDAEGRFEFKTVPPGDYLLGFRILGSSGDEAPYPRTYYPGVAFKSQAGVIIVKEGGNLSNLELRMPPPLIERSVQGFVVWSDGRPAPGADISLGLLEEGESSGSQTIQADDRGHFTLKTYEGLNYKVSAYPRNATGAAAQSEWVEVPQPPDAKPIKLVLPTLKK